MRDELRRMKRTKEKRLDGKYKKSHQTRGMERNMKALERREMSRKNKV